MSRHSLLDARYRTHERTSPRQTALHRRHAIQEAETYAPAAVSFREVDHGIRDCPGCQRLSDKR